MAELVNRTRISTTINNDLLKKFNMINTTTRIDKSKLYDDAIQLLIEKYKDTIDFDKEAQE